MSGSNKPETPASAVGDPSMEDILASIRRILSEDEQQPAPAPPAAAENDVLVLDSSMLRSEPPALPASPAPAAAPPPPAGTAPDPAHDAAHDAAPDPGPDPAPDRAPDPALGPLPADLATTAQPDAAEPETPPGLVAPEAAAAAAASIGSLLRTIASDRALQVRGGGPTIEDIVRQMLRPLVKEWLDTNLPGLVERLVRAEIERVVNRELR